MTYYGPPGRGGLKNRVGIKPTRADRNAVYAWSVLGLTVNEIAAKLGERFNLGKPMSKMTMYYHFRKDLLHKPKGRRKSDKSKIRLTKNLAVEMKRLIEEASKRAKR